MTIRHLFASLTHTHTHTHTHTQDVQFEGSSSANHRVTRSKLEIVFLTHLCVSNPDIIAAAAEGFNRLCEEADILSSGDDDEQTFITVGD